MKGTVEQCGESESGGRRDYDEGLMLKIKDQGICTEAWGEG